ncbi:MAG: autotransporter domain-containing protein [Pseudomonadota bacterium]
MNRVHRITWSKARSAFVVTPENASSGGKPSTTCSAVGAAALMLLLNATPALAANVCTVVNNTISGAQAVNDNCVLSNNGGSVTINNGGTISATDTTVKAISVSGAVGSITNNGTVSAAGTIGLEIASGSTLTGNITNTGSLSSTAGNGAAIYVVNSRVTGALVNDGSQGRGHITGSVVLSGANMQAIQNVNGAQINATGSNANGIDGRNLSTISNGILNGVGSSITATDSAIKLDRTTVGTAGTTAIANQGALTGGAYGMQFSQATINDNIVNTGKISATNAVSWGFYSVAGTMNGSLRNEGVNSEISGNIGIFLYTNNNMTGGIFNEGKIQGNDLYAIRMTNGSKLGGIVNSGSIVGLGATGIDVVQAEITNGINNTGIISGKYSGIAVSTNATLTAGANGTAIYNSNKILVTSPGGGSGTALMVAGTGTKVTGNIVNDTGGTIGNGALGINVAQRGQINGSIYNSGNINGAEYAVQVSSDSTLTAMYAQGSSARYVGDVDARNTDFTVATGAAFSNDNAYNVKGFAVAQGAQFTLTAGNSSSGDLVKGITVGSNGFSNAGTVLVDAGMTAAIHGNYLQAGSGTLRIGGGAAAKLSIDNTATNAGTMELANNATLVAGKLDNNNIVTMANGANITTTSGFNNASTVSVAAGATATVTGNYIQASTGVLQVGSNGGAPAKLTVDGTVTNAGNIVLATTAGLTAGSLSNSGTVTLANGARVETTGGFSNSGILSLGSSVSAAIQGNYTQAGTGVLRVGVNDDTTYAKLAVNGTVNLGSNARIDVDVTRKDQVFNSKRLQNILTATTLNSDGTFAVTDNSTLFNFGAVKEGNAVHLTIAPAAATGGPTVLGSVKETNNTPAVGAATVLDQVIAANPTGPVSNLFVGLTSKEAVSQAVTQALPLLNGGSMAAASGSISGINRVVQARIEANRGLSSGDAALSDKHLWFKPFGSWARQDDRDGVSGFKAGTNGFVMGADASLNERSRLGVGFAYARSQVNGNSSIAPQQLAVDMYQLLGYGSYSLNERTELNFQADIGQNNNRGSRTIAFTGSRAQADYKSWTAHAGVGLGHVLPLGSATAFTPSLRLDYTRIKDSAYAENGAGALNLNVAGRSTQEMVLAVDGKLTHNLNSQTTLSANLGAGYDMLGKKASIVAAFAGAPDAAFATYGMDSSPWSLRAGLGIVRKTVSGMEIAARYDVENRSGFLNQTASVKVRWAF